MGGILMPAFVDRGDPAAYDFTLADFTTDDNIHELDLSAIISGNASAVVIRLRIEDDLVDSFVLLRKQGNTNSINCSVATTMVANTVIENDLVVAIGPNKKIEYRTTNTTFAKIDFIIKGWLT